jgi:hypothetical protein
MKLKSRVNKMLCWYCVLGLVDPSSCTGEPCYTVSLYQHSFALLLPYPLWWVLGNGAVMQPEPEDKEESGASEDSKPDWLLT